MRLALVTGGHRRLGAAIAARLAQAGYALALHGTRDAEPEAELAEVLAQSGTAWHGFPADFADPASATALLTSVTTRFGRAPDLLVNSAAAFGDDRLATTDADALMSHYAINAAAPALLVQAFAAAQTEAEGDRSVVNLLDQRLDQPHGDQFAYTMSKYALAGLTQIAARTLAPRIRVNAVAPGLTLVTDDYDNGQIERLAARMPLSRLPRPAQIADAVLFLAQADATTGQTLYVDGGARLKSFDRDFLHLDR